MLNINSQTSTKNMTFDFDKVNVQNDWLWPLIDAENINDSFNYLKTDNFPIEEYAVKNLSPSKEVHIFLAPWREAFMVYISFVVENSEINFVHCSFPKEGLIYVLNYFHLVEGMKNNLNLNYMLRRGDIDFGWFHINNGFAYEVTHLEEDMISLFIFPTNQTGKGFTRDKSGKVLFRTVD